MIKLGNDYFIVPNKHVVNEIVIRKTKNEHLFVVNIYLGDYTQIAFDEVTQEQLKKLEEEFK